MADEVLIQQLLRDLITSDRTPTEVCAVRPEMLPELRQRWRVVRATVEHLDRLFPSSDPTGAALGGTPLDLGLPQIPGYSVEFVLGHGGMGVVYMARHLALNRPVALKMVLSGAFAIAPERERLFREAQIVAALHHPNIVTVYDVGACDGKPYFTMEFMDGGNLAQRLAGMPQPSREAADAVALLANAVHSAHQAGIVHRDLKPANVLLSASGVLKISDFGLARHVQGEGGLTFPGIPAGTPSYMAPEQARGHADALGPGVDVYSLGALLYEMLTGRPPFRAETALETQRQVVEQEPVPPSRLNGKVPRDLETICLQCLRKEPHKRYLSAAALADDLSRFLRGEPISARRTGAVARAYKWTRRNPARALASVCAVVAVAAILGSSLWTVSVRDTIERAVTDDLDAVVRLERASEWREARNTLERAKTRLAAAAGGARLLTRASHIQMELDLVNRFAAMRFERAASREVEFDRRKWWGIYRDAFKTARLLVDGDTPEAFAARVTSSPARAALVEAMDDMAICAVEPPDLDWLLSATRLADPDAWRDKARDSKIWSDGRAVVAFAHDAPVANQPVTLMLNLGGRLLEVSPAEAIVLIKKVQAAHPSDFWANFALAETLDERKDADAIGYYRAAIALRPEASVAHINLAFALDNQNRIDEAIESMEQATQLDSRSFVAQYNLASMLLRRHRAEAALKHVRLATQIDHPQRSAAFRLLGITLAKIEHYCEAADAFRHALQTTPQDEALAALLARAMKECREGSGSTVAPEVP